MGKIELFKNKPVIIGISGAIGVFIIFWGILMLVNKSFNAALQEFSRVWYWSILLSSGFGFQLGLYSYIRSRVHKKFTGATAEVAASGTISTGSMIACCAHALVNILPILGISAVAMFLVRFQLPLILIGVFSNLIGITMMAGIMQKHLLILQTHPLQLLFRYDMKKVRNILIPVSLIIVAFSFFMTASQPTEAVAANEQQAVLDQPTEAVAANEQQTLTFTLAAQENHQNYVDVEVKPHDVSFTEPVKFDIAFNTHQVSLNFDVAKISSLKDDKDTVYKPLRWEGSPPGGHHRSGTLIFPKLAEGTKAITLTLKNISKVPERKFTWKLE